MKLYSKAKNWQKPPHFIADIHEFSPNQWLALSISISGEDLWHVQYARYVALFQRLAQYAMFELRPELSTSLRLHYHGIIKPKSYSKVIGLLTLLNDMKSHYTYSVNKIDDSIVWYLYCIKDRHIMKPFIQSTKNEKGTRRTYKLSSGNITLIPSTSGATIHEDFSKYFDISEKDFD